MIIFLCVHLVCICIFIHSHKLCMNSMYQREREREIDREWKRERERERDNQSGLFKEMTTNLDTWRHRQRQLDGGWSCVFYILIISTIEFFFHAHPICKLHDNMIIFKLDLYFSLTIISTNIVNRGGPNVNLRICHVFQPWCVSKMVGMRVQSGA